jgi:Family of unknown function (DUF6186)
MTRPLFLALWALGALLLVGAELAARVSHGRWARLSELLDRMTDRTVSFVALFVGWMFVGWHLFAR